MVAVREVARQRGIADSLVNKWRSALRKVANLPEPIEWLSDNGNPYYVAGYTRRFARDIASSRALPRSAARSLTVW